MDGVLLIDKPTGQTSFDVVRAVRQAACERKVGHAGTLDPLASGLLVVAVGQATKLIPYLMDSEKRYTGTVALGSQTDTDDAQGEIIEQGAVPALEAAGVRKVLQRFVGSIEQIPPVYSALKQDGVPLYKKARRGEKVSPKPRIVEIIRIELLGLSPMELEIDVYCKKGTYIRSLARDIAIDLGTRGHLKSLTRTETSGFFCADALPLERLNPHTCSQNLLSLKDALPALPALALSPNDVSRIQMGQPLVPIEPTDFPTVPTDPAPYLRLIDPEGRLLAIGFKENESIRPIRVMVY